MDGQRARHNKSHLRQAYKNKLLYNCPYLVVSVLDIGDDVDFTSLVRPTASSAMANC